MADGTSDISLSSKVSIGSVGALQQSTTNQEQEDSSSVENTAKNEDAAVISVGAEQPSPSQTYSPQSVGAKPSSDETEEQSSNDSESEEDNTSASTPPGPDQASKVSSSTSDLSQLASAKTEEQ